MRFHRLPIVLISLALGPIPAIAGHAQGAPRDPGYHDQARVVEVVPIREVARQVTPHQECWTEEVEHVRHYDGDGAYTLAGSILGGVVGHQLGGGSGQYAATAAGSVLGAVIGHDIGRSHAYERTYTTAERRCQTVIDDHARERIVGYRVTYDYGGRTYTTDMDRHPGRYVRVRVSVAPVE
jgi:uncharacterized protein YcfJ